MVEVALAAAVALHRVEAQLERRDPLRAVGAADRAVHRALDRERGGLDQLRPVVDRVERVEVLDAARIRDGDEPLELPVVLHRQGDPLLVGEAPEDVRGDRAAEVGVELGEALVGGDHPVTLRGAVGGDERLSGAMSAGVSRSAMPSKPAAAERSPVDSEALSPSSQASAAATNACSSGSTRGSIVCGTGVSRHSSSAPAAADALDRGAAELDRDHRVERAVGDRDRIAVETRQVELEALHLRHEARQRHDRRRPGPARAEAERPAHHGALREAAEDDALHRHRQRVEERRSGLEGGEEGARDRAWGCRRAGTSGRRPAAARAARAA